MRWPGHHESGLESTGSTEPVAGSLDALEQVEKVTAIFVGVKVGEASRGLSRPRARSGGATSLLVHQASSAI